MKNYIESELVRKIVESYLNNEIGIRTALNAIYESDASVKDVEIARQAIIH